MIEVERRIWRDSNMKGIDGVMDVGNTRVDVTWSFLAREIIDTRPEMGTHREGRGKIQNVDL